MTWSDFVKEAQLFPGQGYDNSMGAVTSPGYKPKERDYSLVAKGDPRFERAYRFFGEIAPAIRMREFGVDRLPDDEVRTFEHIQNVPVRMYAKGKWNGGDNANGYYHSEYRPARPARHQRKDWLDDINLLGHLLGHYRGTPARLENEHIALRDDASARTLVHEMRHALAGRIPFGSNELVNEVYGFNGKNIKPEAGEKGMEYSKAWGNEEQYTTNKEHQFRIYDELWDKLKRAPTAAEYMKATEDMGNVQSSFSSPVNGYEHAVGKSVGGNGRDDFESSPQYAEWSNKMDKAGVPRGMVRVNRQTLFSDWFSMLPVSDQVDIMKDISDGKVMMIYPRNMIMSKAKAQYMSDKTRDQMMDAKKQKLMREVSQSPRPGANVNSWRSWLGRS